MNKGTFSSPRFSPRFSSRSSRCGGENSKLCCGGGKNLGNQMHYFKVAQPFATLKGPFSAESAIRNSSTIVYLSRLDEIYLLVHSKSWISLHRKVEKMKNLNMVLTEPAQKRAEKKQECIFSLGPCLKMCWNFTMIAEFFKPTFC